MPRPPSSRSDSSPRPALGRLEALAHVADLHHQPVGLELVDDLDLARPPFPYACLTEFVHASVKASFRSCSVSSETGRTPAIAVSASRPRVMYSALAGIVSRTGAAPIRSTVELYRLFILGIPTRGPGVA